MELTKKHLPSFVEPSVMKAWHTFRLVITFIIQITFRSLMVEFNVENKVALKECYREVFVSNYMVLTNIFLFRFW